MVYLGDFKITVLQRNFEEYPSYQSAFVSFMSTLVEIWTLNSVIFMSPNELDQCGFSNGETGSAFDDSFQETGESA